MRPVRRLGVLLPLAAVACEPHAEGRVLVRGHGTLRLTRLDHAGVVAGSETPAWSSAPDTGVPAATSRPWRPSARSSWRNTRRWRRTSDARAPTALWGPHSSLPPPVAPSPQS